MKRILFVFALAVFFAICFAPQDAHAQTIAQRLSGRIVLDVENNGEAWYISPENNQRYFLGRPDDAFDIMRFLSLGVTDDILNNIPTNNDAWAGDTGLRRRLSGKILLQVQQNGEAWYMYPVDRKRYFLGRPDDAFEIMSELGLGISNADLVSIPIASDFLTVGETKTETFQSFALTTTRGTFNVEVATLDKDKYEMVTVTGNTSDCSNNCAAHSLECYVKHNNAFAGIHGSYFCPPDYSWCANQTYSFLSPVFNTAADKFINQEKLLFHGGPLMIVDTEGNYYYYHRSVEAGRSERAWEEETQPGKQIQAAISNYPSLVENGRVIVDSEPLSSDLYNRALRGGIGYNNDRVFLVVARNASVVDLGYVMKELGADWAMNLDGGASTSLYYDGKYKYQGSRLLPNAVLFKK